MSNQLSMASIPSIETLHRSGHSNREIARILGIDRGAVNNHVKRLQAVEAVPVVADKGLDQVQNRPNLRTGSVGEEAGEEAQNRPNPLMGQVDLAAPVVVPSLPGRSGPKSQCEPFRDLIESKLEQGLSCMYGDLFPLVVGHKGCQEPNTLKCWNRCLTPLVSRWGIQFVSM